MGIAFALVLVASALPAQAAYAYAPLAVVAGHASTDSGTVLAFVAWTRGSEAADEYRVYGVNGTTFELLQVESGTGTPVPAGYSTYAVTGVLLGVESDPVYATIVPCVYVEPVPPPPGYAIGECISGTVVEG